MGTTSRFISGMRRFIIKTYKDNSWVYYVRDSVKKDDVWKNMSTNKKRFWVPAMYLVIFLTSILKSFFIFFLVGLLYSLIMIPNIPELATELGVSEFLVFIFLSLAFSILFTSINTVLSLLIEGFVAIGRLFIYSNE